MSIGGLASVTTCCPRSGYVGSDNDERSTGFHNRQNANHPTRSTVERRLRPSSPRERRSSTVAGQVDWRGHSPRHRSFRSQDTHTAVAPGIRSARSSNSLWKARGSVGRFVSTIDVTSARFAVHFTSRRQDVRHNVHYGSCYSNNERSWASLDEV